MGNERQREREGVKDGVGPYADIITATAAAAAALDTVIIVFRRCIRRRRENRIRIINAASRGEKFP